jgi:peptidase M48-like protein
MSLQLQTRSTAPDASSLQAERAAGSGPAAVAAARVGRAGGILVALGLASSLFVIFRLVETWRVAPRASHEVSFLGEKLSYPAVNLAAVVVVGLAALGLAVVARALAGAVREVLASRRLHRRLLAHQRRGLDDVLVIVDERPRAFCAGLLRPRVYISTGALALLDELALRAVLAHERHHARRRDPLRLATGRVIAGALFCVPGVRDLVRRQCSLIELGADESAMNAGPDHRSALARAMLSFSERSHSGDPTGIDPERVEHLLEEAPSWRFPFLVCLFAGSVLALLAAVGVLAGQVASGSSTLAPPVLSRQPCVVVLAAIPALAGLVALRLRRHGRAVTDR